MDRAYAWYASAAFSLDVAQTAELHCKPTFRVCLDQLLIVIKSLVIVCDYVRSTTRLIAITAIAKLASVRLGNRVSVVTSAAQCLTKHGKSTAERRTVRQRMSENSRPDSD